MNEVNSSKKKSTILVICLCIIVAIAEIGMFIYNQKNLLNQKSKIETISTANKI